RVAMCVGTCSRIVGPCLLVLGTLSVAANVLLLFPGGVSRYLVEGHISKHAKVMPGVWGGGITVLLAATHITAVGWRCAGCSDCGTRRNVRQRWDPCAKTVPSGTWLSSPLCSPSWSSWAPAHLSGVGLTNGPLCFYNASEHGPGHGTLWGYPFLDASGQKPDTSILHLPLSLSHSVENYLHDRRTWSICLEPVGIVAWNVVLFSILLLISAAEMVLASLQILNGCLRCLCGFCEGK
ncbi:Transmembrane 4 L6 family member 1, partial [Chlamydotis macqueenii]